VAIVVVGGFFMPLITKRMKKGKLKELAALKMDDPE
jgi:hypothetical protein